MQIEASRAAFLWRAIGPKFSEAKIRRRMPAPRGRSGWLRARPAAIRFLRLVRSRWLEQRQPARPARRAL